MVNPKQGDLIMIDAEPHVGHEEGGHDPASGNIRRPFVVVSKDQYNVYTGMIIGMPITSKLRVGPTYVQVADVASGIHGSIITYQMQNYDFSGRHGEIIGKLSPSTVKDLTKRAKQVF